MVGTITVQAEVQTNLLRTDITYYKTGTTPGATKRAFAVVELKKRGVLHLGKFQDTLRNVPAFAQTYTTPTGPQRNLNADPFVQQIALEATNSGNPEKTFFKENALKAIKQIASYAMNCRTQYAALFDWDVLILVRFPNINPSLTARQLFITGIGLYCEITIIPYAQSYLMRPALLGFLRQAYANTPPV